MGTLIKTGLVQSLSKGLKVWAVILLTCLWCTSANAFFFDSKDTFKTEYFQVKLKDGWEVQGRPQNSERALNVNFMNKSNGTRINIVVGAAKTTTRDQLNQMRAAIRSQGGQAHQIRSRGNVNYFTFILGKWPGFCYVNTDGKDQAVIMAVGNRQSAADFIGSFTKRNKALFPDF